MGEMTPQTERTDRESPSIVNVSETIEPSARPFRNRWNPMENRDELVAEICARLELGEPLAHICNGSRHLPSTRVLWDWEKQDEQIAAAISRARQLGAHAMASDLLKVAYGEEEYSSGDTNRDKLIVDTSLKLLAKWNPRQYGDNLQVRHADADGGKLDTAPLVGELLTMLGAGASAALNITPQGAQPAIDVMPRQPAIGNAQQARRAFELPPADDRPGYKPRAKRLIPPPAVDDLV